MAAFDVLGVPPSNVHDQEVGFPVDKSVKFTDCPTIIFVTLELKFAVGGFLILSFLQPFHNDAPAIIMLIIIIEYFFMIKF